jgi:heme A synthase
VAKNASLKRGFSVSLHLANTFVLLACLLATAYFASGGAPPRPVGRGKVYTLLGPALGGVLLLGTSGAIAALGDTLFPARSLAEGFSQDFSAAAHIFLRLRVLHPFLALGVGAYVVLAAALVRARWGSPQVQRLSRLVVLVYLTQFAAGFLNMVLLAPVAMQLVHLLLADALWLTLIALGLSALGEPQGAAPPAHVPVGARPAA